MVVTNHTSGFGVFAAFAIVPILIAIIAVARGKPIAATLASVLALVVGSLFWGYGTHSVVRTSSPAMPAEWDSNSVIWTLGNPGPKVQWTEEMMPPTAMQTGAKMVTFGFIGFVFLPILFILGVVLFARAMSRKQPRRERVEQGEAWHEPRRGGRSEWGLGTVVLGVVLVVGILGAKTIFGVRMAQQQAMPQRSQMARTESLGRRNLRAPVQNLTVSAEHPALQDTRPLEMVIEEFDRPRIPLDQSDKTATEHAPAEQPLTADEHAPAAEHAATEKLTAAETQTTAAADSQPGSSPRDETQSASPTEIRTTPEKAVLIKMDADKLRQYSLTDGTVASILEQRGVWKGAVTVARDRSGKQITAVGPIRDTELLPRVILTAMHGRAVYLSDVATITENLLDPLAESGTRPAWVDAPSQRYGDTLREVVAVGDYSTTEECVVASKERVLIAVWDHIQSLVGRMHPIGAENVTTGDDERDYQLRFNSAIAGLNRLGISYDYIRREIITNEYVEEVERSVGKMHRMYTQLEFRPQVDQFLRQQWVAREQSWRVRAVRLVAFLSLSLVGLVWGLLKVDTMTKGYYSKRLFLGVPALIALAFFLFLLTNPF
jgi:cytoskeletal protein RodZ